ncbi:membrane protein insertase YidC [Sinisalibacter lacisalsi]|uniref:Membrane protein insertase YidC n=1 Tax=Sinisalibacter lacisalsi TaxID=1526570 RepID=A0ABQ1QEB8_9RHOB|nr:membrane protein insertase YidC [Sinisalibacter lacisalsi]GGD24731.1 membrane protein insertase YidC [Sinisalibacter lacisalsi]
MKTQTQNTILALVLSFLVITAWTLLFPPVEPALDTTAPLAGETAADGDVATPPAAGVDAATTAGVATSPEEDRSSALAESPRIEIDTPDLEGSISLLGGRIDDLRLKGYRETIDDDADIVTLLTPAGQDDAYYALYGWAPGGALELGDVPGATTAWEIENGERLTPSTPVTLSWTNARNMTFRRTIAVDENYMFTVTQSVENGSGAAQRLAPYGVIARHGMPDDLKGFFILHEGVVRQTDQELSEVSYKDVTKFELDPREGAAAETMQVTENGWIGFTDHYWMTVLAPEPGQAFTSVAKYATAADIFQTEVRLPTVEVAPGASTSSTTRLFAGAKEWETIREYENSEGIYRFLDSIDWGMFFFITKPMFAVLHWLNMLIGNMGWAIIGLTVVIKLVLFPLSYKSYVSMARMRELQPEMEKIKERVGDDKQAQQKEMMELYKREKVNPASGCLPILLQIPIWFSLYKVIFVTLELRHAPWIGWIRDLSAPDPSSIFNLFGLLPYAAPGPDSMIAFFSLGILPILLGVSMWLQQKLNPAPTDPTQAMIMGWLPWVFMFMLGTFASGLVLYWIANNVLTFTQQYTIMLSHGHKPDLFGNIKSSFKRKPKDDKK